MEKKQALLIAVLVLSVTGIAMAQDAQVNGTVGLTYQSSYIWKGFDVYEDNHSAIEPFIDLQCPDTGFGFSVVGHMANDSDAGFGNNERWDYSLYYTGDMFADEVYATNYRIGYVRYNYPDRPAHQLDIEELHTVLSFPKVLGVEGLVPSYALVKLWPSSSSSSAGSRSSFNGTASGFAHVFMLDYPLVIKGFAPETPEQVLRLHAEAVYNDGVGPTGERVEHDWSHAVFGIATDFDLGNNLILTPGAYYQSSWEDSVNKSDEAYVTLTIAYKF